jgi:hypothetical protein
MHGERVRSDPEPGAGRGPGPGASRSGDLPEPDRVVDYAEGEYVALWDEQKLALIVEVEGREL